MKAQNLSTSLGEGRDAAPSLAHPSQKTNPGRLHATIYRLHLKNGDRQPVKTLTMRDPTGGFGVTRVLTMPDGHYFAYNTFRQLSEMLSVTGTTLIPPSHESVRSLS